MKLSTFNFYIKKNNDTFIFNTYSRKTLKLPNTILEKLESKNMDIDESIKEVLEKNRFITNLENMKEEYLDFYKRKEYINEHRMYINLTVTTLCNLSCEYCFENHTKRISMDENTLINLINNIENKLKNENIEELECILFGGEPLLNYKITKKAVNELTEICKKYDVKFKCNMTTNGIINDEKMLKELSLLGVQKVQITLDGNENINNERRKNLQFNVYKTVLKNLKIYQKYFKVTIKFNFDKINIKYFEFLLEDLNNLGLDKNKILIKIEAIAVTKNLYNKFFNPMEIEMVNAYFYLIELLNKNKFKFDFSSVFPTPCMVSSPNSFLIEPNGEISSCISAFEIKEFNLGNINNLKSLNFLNEKTKLFNKKDFSMNHCLTKECEMLPICEGGCALENYYFKKEYQCKERLYKEFLEKFLEKRFLNDE